MGSSIQQFDTNRLNNSQLRDVAYDPQQESLQETGVLSTHKYVGENAKYVGKGYPDVQNGVGKNVGRNASREAFPTPSWYSVGKGFPDAGRCVGIDGVGKT
ncbi:hypothetical protein E5676_scaffold1428G001000 [Cucumis melo var. makuwa]|uniref:Uncharacterized protein n=1 Tax=Cucumis melo var. makuwa TaxID=1194695 RepID=A0A5D3DFP6_CUCMM|nr:hypothetical protein E5676_scaffold1428G001000 [Cucumis melo var. makuwa]